MTNSIDEKRLLEELRDPDEAVRRNAAEILGDMKIAKGIPLLVEVLADESVGVAEAAADALVSIDGAETAEKVYMLLGSEEAVLRNFSCEILEKIGEPAVESLLKAMESPDKDIRKFGADVVGAIGSGKSVNLLIELLKDKEVNVAAAAAEALGKIGDRKAVPSLFKAFNGDSWVKCSVAKALGMIGGKEASMSMLKISRQENDMVLFSVVNALGDIGDEETIGMLAKILEWDRPFMTGSIVQSLEKIMDRAGEKVIRSIRADIHLDPFLGLLNDPDKSIRISAVKMLGRLKNKKALSYIVSLLLDKDGEMREVSKEAIIRIAPSELSPLAYILGSKAASSDGKEAVVEIIGELRWKQGVHTLLDMLDDESFSVRRATVKALGKIGSAEAIFALIKSLKDEDGHTRSEAALALGRIGTDKAGEPIFALLGDRYRDVREAAATSLSMFESGFITDRLLSAFNSSEPEERRLALLALTQSNYKDKTGVMFKGLNDRDWEVRCAGLDSLGIHIRTKKISKLRESQVDNIIKMLDDEIGQVRVEAVSLMPCIESSQRLKRLLDRLKIERDKRVRYEIVMAIGSIGGSEAVSPLVSLMRNEDDLIRMAVISALGNIGDKKAADALEQLLEHDNTELAEAAESALKKRGDAF